ncbi:MAG: DNA recombination protein RmuC [Gammaproteobacteria bacterium]|nr:MAG: DNA recombination protein RmuC [Gammaproteobacteria bacterium]RLA49728.1 MAG: DNA recombination protein RmuC [Gammaproteobacteria bacterium]
MATLPLAFIIAAATLGGLVIGYTVAAWRARNVQHIAEKREAELVAEAKATSQRISEREMRIETLSQKIETEESALNSERQALAAMREQSRGHEVHANKAEQQIDELKHTAASKEQNHSSLNERYQQLIADHAQLKTSLDEKQLHFDKQLKLLDENKQQLKTEFENLANQIFENKGKAFTEANRQSLDGVLGPFKKQIEDFKKQAADIHHKDTQQQAHLRSELGQLKELNKQITEEAHSLATALKGQHKMQGNWGELVLENVLDRSGLVLGKDYEREVSFNLEEGGRARPDAIIYLPQGKHLVIDAKVSLNAYTRFVNSEDDAERQLALKEHVEAFASRIKELADRNYYKLPGLNSPEMVFMFVPIESAFVEALKADEALLLQAIEQNVLVATPTTMLTSLNIVRQLWRYEDQNKHTAELAKKADGVFRKLNTFLASFQNVKSGLDKAHEAYQKAEGQLVSGKGNLVKQVGEFKNLAPAIQAELPDYFTDKADLEIDYVPATNPDDKAEIPNAGDKNHPVADRNNG